MTQDETSRSRYVSEKTGVLHSDTAAKNKNKILITGVFFFF